MKRILIAITVGVVLSVFVAFAAGLTVDGGVIQAGSDGTLYCDANGVKVVGWGLETDNGKVYFVRIDDIDGSCAQADMFVNLYDSGGNKIGGGKAAAPLTIPQTKVSFDSPVLAVDIEKITVFLEGPAP